MSNFESPTIITVKQFDTEIKVTLDHSGLTVQEMLSAFKSLMMALGYQKENLDECLNID